MNVLSSFSDYIYYRIFIKKVVFDTIYYMNNLNYKYKYKYYTINFIYFLLSSLNNVLLKLFISILSYFINFSDDDDDDVLLLYFIFYF